MNFINVRYEEQSLREKYPNREIFRAVFSCNTGTFSLNVAKHGPEKTSYLDTFQAVNFITFSVVWVD